LQIPNKNETKLTELPFNSQYFDVDTIVAVINRVLLSQLPPFIASI